MPWVIVNGDLCAIVISHEIGREPEQVQAVYAAISPNVGRLGGIIGYRVLRERIYELCAISPNNEVCCVSCMTPLEDMVTERGLERVPLDDGAIVVMPNFCAKCVEIVAPRHMLHHQGGSA